MSYYLISDALLDAALVSLLSNLHDLESRGLIVLPEGSVDMLYAVGRVTGELRETSLGLPIVVGKQLVDSVKLAQQPGVRFDLLQSEAEEVK